jgi:hypothetical protein
MREETIIGEIPLQIPEIDVYEDITEDINKKIETIEPEYWYEIGLTHNPHTDDNLFKDLVVSVLPKSNNRINNRINNEINYINEVEELDNSIVISNEYYKTYLDNREILFITHLHFSTNILQATYEKYRNKRINERPIVILIGSPFHYSFWKMEHKDHIIHQFETMCYLDNSCFDENITLIPDNHFKIIQYYDIENTRMKNKSSHLENTKIRKIPNSIIALWNQMSSTFNNHDYSKSFIINQTEDINSHNLFFVILLDLIEQGVSKIIYPMETFNELFQITESYRYCFINQNSFTSLNDLEIVGKINMLRWIYLREPRIDLNEKLESIILYQYQQFWNRLVINKNRLYMNQILFWNIYKKIIENYTRNNVQYNIRYIPFTYFNKLMNSNRSSIQFNSFNELIIIYQDQKMTSMQILQWINYLRSFQTSIDKNKRHIIYLITDYTLYQSLVIQHPSLNPQNLTELMNNEESQKIVYIMQNTEWRDKIQYKLRLLFRTNKDIYQSLIWLLYFISLNNSSKKISIPKEILNNVLEYERLFYYYIYRKNLIQFDQLNPHKSFITFD